MQCSRMLITYLHGEMRKKHLPGYLSYKQVIFKMYFFFLILRKNRVMGTHSICLYQEVDKKCTGCNLKTTVLLDCELIGVCAVIR